MNTILFYFHCSLLKTIRDPFLHHVDNTILYINEMNKIDKIHLFMSKEFVGYFTNRISEMIGIRHDKLFVKNILILNTTKLTDKLKWVGS